MRSWRHVSSVVPYVQGVVRGLGVCITSVCHCATAGERKVKNFLCTEKKHMDK